MVSKIRKEFWHKVPLDKMNRTEWEALCDRCGKCCLIKLQDNKTNKIAYTRIACRMFNHSDCSCKSYGNRRDLVEDCCVLDYESLKEKVHWMPSTCAYRLLFEGKKLKQWHHLISGSFTTVHQSGNSIKNSTIPEFNVPQKKWSKYRIKDQC